MSTFNVISASAEPAPLALPVTPRQMIVVITKDWQAVDGQLQRFEFAAPKWQPVGQPIPIVVGRNGMAWGLGFHPMPQTGPQKKEGDGRSPAGVYGLNFAFGYEPPGKLPGLKIPYVQCTGTLECVDDPASKHYNEVLDRNSVDKPDWNSSEHMLLKNNQYRLGLNIAHNAAPPKSGAGSCVFMHIWEKPGAGTAGCTAMTEGSIEAIVAWIDIQAYPMLVQLPAAEYHRLKTAWKLPDLPPEMGGGK